MIVYKIKDNKVLKVECERLEHLELDADGDTIYLNTHFKDKEKAYNNAISECNAVIKLLKKMIVSKDKELNDFKNDLTNTIDNKIKLIKELEKLKDS